MSKNRIDQSLIKDPIEKLSAITNDRVRYDTMQTNYVNQLNSNNMAAKNNFMDIKVHVQLPYMEDYCAN